MVVSIEDIIKSTTNLKHRLIISLIHETAATSKDIIFLKLSDFDVFRNTLKINNVTYPVNGTTITILCEYVAQNNMKDFLFSNKRGGFILHSHINRIVTYSHARTHKHEYGIVPTISITPLEIRRNTIKQWSKNDKGKAEKLSRLCRKNFLKVIKD